MQVEYHMQDCTRRQRLTDVPDLGSIVALLVREDAECYVLRLLLDVNASRGGNQ